MPFWTRRRYCFLLCRSSVLSGVWLFRMRCRGAAFSASPGSAAPCFLSMYWGSFLLLRGFQRCRFGPAAGTFFLPCLSSDLSDVWLFRMHCRGAAFSASPGSAAPCVLSMYWGSFLLGSAAWAVALKLFHMVQVCQTHCGFCLRVTKLALIKCYHFKPKSVSNGLNLWPNPKGGSITFPRVFRWIFR